MGEQPNNGGKNCLQEAPRQGIVKGNNLDIKRAARKVSKIALSNWPFMLFSMKHGAKTSFTH